MSKKRNNNNKEVKYLAQTLSKSIEFMNYTDLINMFYKPNDLVTKSEVRNKLKEYLGREV